jgi:cyanate permease
VILTRYRWQFDLLCIAIAVLGGFIAGAVDFRNDEPQAAVLVIVVFAGLLGLVQPKKAWRWAIIVGLGVPIVYLIATALGYQPKSVPEPGWYASLIALIPAFISTYSGVLLRKAISAG